MIERNLRAFRSWMGSRAKAWILVGTAALCLLLLSFALLYPRAIVRAAETKARLSFGSDGCFAILSRWVPQGQHAVPVNYTLMEQLRTRFNGRAHFSAQASLADVSTRLATGAGATSNLILIAMEPYFHPDMSPYPLLAGRNLTEQDEAMASQVCMLSQGAAEKIGATQSSLGSALFVNGLPFTLVGITRESRLDRYQGDSGAVVFIPFSTGKKRFKMGHKMVIVVAPLDPIAAGRVENEVAAEVRKLHGIAGGNQDDFWVVSSKNIAAANRMHFKNIRYGAAIAAGIAFLLGIAVLTVVNQASLRQEFGSIAVRRCFGATSKGLFIEAMLATMALGSAGCLIGLALLEILIEIFSRRFLSGFNPAGFLFLDPIRTCVAVVGTLGMICASCAFPFWRVSRTEIARLLRT